MFLVVHTFKLLDMLVVMSRKVMPKDFQFWPMTDSIFLELHLNL